MTSQPAAEPTTFRGLRVGVVGLGVEGVDIVRFLAAEGAAAIVVSDRRPAAELSARLAELDGIDLRLQPNDPTIAESVDALFVSQGVPDTLPLVQAARARRVPVTAMMRHFLHRCPAPAIGITGSAGKTTTTTLVGDMLRAAGRRTFVGGNIGTGLLSALPTIDAGTDVVLEISHTQLVRTDRSPHLAAVLNVTPNHLDQFDWDSYVNLKRNLVRYQGPDDLVVLPSDEPVAAALAHDTPARVFRFGLAELGTSGATVDEGAIVWQDQTSRRRVCPLDALRIPGEHNLRNALAAVAIAGAWGLDAAPMGAAIRAFRGVPHRLQAVAEIDGVRYLDDSIATAPERTVAALRAVTGPIVLLLGGREKSLPLDALAREARARCRAVVCFGEAGATFASALRAAWSGDAGAPSVEVAPDLAAAVAAGRGRARAGDTVLLAPAGTSFDAYANFEARGDHFAQLARGEECD